MSAGPATENGDMSPTHAQGAAQGRSLLSPEYRWVTIAALALVTIGAYENRAVTTILPIVATELDGLRWFGLATALPAATFLFASALGGRGPTTSGRDGS